MAKSFSPQVFFPSALKKQLTRYLNLTQINQQGHLTQLVACNFWVELFTFRDQIDDVRTLG